MFGGRLTIVSLRVGYRLSIRGKANMRLEACQTTHHF
jgi:hypothetical protein